MDDGATAASVLQELVGGDVRYNMWRGFAIRNVVDARLADFGLGAGSTEALKALDNLLAQAPYTALIFFVRPPTPTQPKPTNGLSRSNTCWNRRAPSG